MDTKAILIVDCRTQKGREIVQKALRKIRPLAKYADGDVPLEALERMVSVLVNRYLIRPQWISMTYDLEECTDDINGHYSCGVKTSDTHEWLGSATGCTIYELYAKLVILMYTKVKSGKVGPRYEG